MAKEGMKSLIRVEILGQEYTVKSDEGEERVKDIAEYVNRKIKEVSERTKTVSTLNLAILAAMNIANDYLEAVEDKNAFTRTIEDKSLIAAGLSQSRKGSGTPKAIIWHPPRKLGSKRKHHTAFAGDHKT
jgi:cell division protein ZapA